MSFQASHNLLTSGPFPFPKIGRHPRVVVSPRFFWSVHAISADSTAGSAPILLPFYCWFCSHSTVIALLMYITSLIGCWLSCIPFVCIYVCMHVLCVGEVNCVGNSHLTLTLAFLQNNWATEKLWQTVVIKYLLNNRKCLSKVTSNHHSC